MPIKWLLAVLLFSSFVSLSKQQDLDTESVHWLISQVQLGEIEQDLQLMTDSLDKLLSIAPNNIEVQCAQAHVYFALAQNSKATNLLSKLKGEHHPCIKQISLLARVNDQDRASVQEAKLLARAGQYSAAIALYDNLFKSTYPSIEYEFEYINWLAQSDDNWQQALRGYRSLLKRYPESSRIELTYAKHLLEQNPQNNDALRILNHYAHSKFLAVEAESAWLSALEEMPISKQTDNAYQSYFLAYPKSNKGKLQYNDFAKQLEEELIKQADPAYQAWQKGVIALENEKYNQANRYFTTALAGRPKDPEVLSSLGLLKLRQGDNAAAYRYFKKAEQLSDNVNRIAVLKGLATTAKFWQYINLAELAIDDNNLNRAKLQLDLAHTLDEDPLTVLFYRAQLAEKAGQAQQAMVYYQQILAQEPLQARTLGAMLTLTSSDDNFSRSHQFYNQLTAKQQALITEQYTRIQSRQLRARADELTAAGKLDQAVNLLLLAIKQTPRESWLYYDLANLYQQQGLLNHAKALYNKTLWQFPLDAELRYSHALFLRSLNDYQGALDTLSYVPNNARTADVAQLAQQLSINAKMSKLANNGEDNKSTIIYNLTELEAQPLTPLMQAELAAQWQQINEYNYALRQLRTALERDDSLSPYWHMTYAQWLLNSDKEQQTQQWFAHYQLPKVATEEQQIRWLSLQTDYINKFNQGEQRLEKLALLAQQNPNNPVVYNALITANIELNRPQAAIDLYQLQVQQGQKLAPETELAVARVSRELNHHALADRIVTTLINDVDKDQTYQQQLLMTALVDFQDEGNLIRLTNELLVKSGYSQEMYYQAAQVAETHNKNAYAETWYKEAIEPNSSIKAQSDATLNYKLYALNDEAPWYVNNAKRELARIQQREQAYITAGINFSSQTSTQNDASLGAGSMPIEVGLPLWHGTGIIKLDPMTIASQVTRFDESFSGSRYGQGALCIFDCPLNSIEPQQEGIDIGFAWLNDTWRFDIGTTPLGFLVEDIVWGVDYNGDIGNFGYEITLNKRPVTSSVLSYAGLEDVFTNEVWGGVRATTLRFNLSHDLGLDWGFWGSADLQLLQGKNVKDNQRYSLMGGAYHRYIREKNTELTFGASLLHWSYQYNLSEETFGHGGYYSPQSYLGVSMPVTYDRRVNNDFIYRVRAGISWSTTTNDDSDFFPNDPQLQAQAQQRTSITGVDPVFAGSTTSGMSYNLAGSFEYRYTPHWFFGGFFSLDRADFYEPNYAQLYFRYYFKPVYSEMIFPGTPVVPYADY
ncbi:MAG TPA: tetratricopeptide repeat protein [Pseudoalteromonas prydzensis]|uniref:Tetratricopeptide repeat protein n=2 Tax=root TaxID=1 RepID=A0A7V1GGP6_9GAMM|nr:cellulose synthase subunit BcsC-related outer membrane protein [Pseudoalteromonas prydzensis]HEA19130.1 tetratricopeptide repeat protein [Pseudoalteromonas prydzensis]